MRLSATMIRNIRWWLIALLISFLGGWSTPIKYSEAAEILMRPQAITITMTTDPLLVLDSNSPCVQGPNAAYVGFQITNTGSSLTNLNVSLSGFASGFSLAGGQAANQYLGTLGPNASDTMYWYITYPCTIGQSNSLTVSVFSGSTLLNSGSATVTTNSSISANAGGLVNSTSIGAGAVIGQIIPMDVEYSFGNTSNGDRFNLQPAGNPTFNAGCFQLMNAEILASAVTAIPVGTKDRLFFLASTNQGGSGNLVSVRYFFRYLCTNTTSTALPYAAQTSGATNVKYTGNYGTCATTTCTTTYPSASNPFTLSKRVTPSILPVSGGVVTYTVTISNTSNFPSSLDRLDDQLPTGISYGSMLTGIGKTSPSIAISSTLKPAFGETNAIRWQGGMEETIFPYGSFVVPANNALQLVYTATVAPGAGLRTNLVTGQIGGLTIDPASATVSVGAPTAMTMMGLNASWGANGVQIRWITGIEVDNAGFSIMRNTIPSLINAQAVTSALIPALGSGTRYTWIDSTAQPATTYWYWIKSIDSNGEESYSIALEVAEQPVYSIWLPTIANSH